MKRHLFRILSVASLAAPASAATHVYMTGEDAPWGISADDNGSPEAAMQIALGKTDWKSAFGFTTDVFNGATFVYLEGGDGSGLAKFLESGGRDAVESFVKSGGAVLVNAARNDGDEAVNAGFGLTLTGGRYSDIGKLTDAGFRIGLDGGDAGTRWSGNYFSHDSVSCELYGCKTALSFIDGSEGSTLMGAAFGKGFLMVGGMTAPFWQSDGGANLRANMITHASAQSALVSADELATAGVVPEPASWAMMIAGFGLIGFEVRRRRKAPMLHTVSCS
jgi:hypothetical protein